LGVEEKKEKSTMVKHVMIGMLLCSIVFCGTGFAGQADAEQAALAVAQSWLQLVDEGNYRGSWDSASGYFKKAVTKKQWEQQIQAVREPLGKTVSRTVKSKQYTTTLPGAPDGEYVVIQFDSSFTNKKTAVETVTPMLDKDGMWRVSGYYIK
jgi:hypothetical protein